MIAWNHQGLIGTEAVLRTDQVECGTVCLVLLCHFGLQASRKREKAQSGESGLRMRQTNAPTPDFYHE